MPSPLGMLNPAALPAQSRRVGMDTELRLKSVLLSIYTSLAGMYNAQKQSMPNGIYMKISDKATKGSYRTRITMLERLSEAGVLGDNVAIGHEEQPKTRVAEVYHNNCRKVVSVPGYGIDKLHADYLGLFEQHIDNLGDWNKEQEDLEIHQALLQTFGETLTTGETASACPVNWNPNIFIAGIGAHGAQPQYSPALATFTSRIVAALGATTGGTAVSTVLNNDTLSNISNYALFKRIEPLDLPGTPSGKGYVLTMSELQAMALGDPGWAARNLGSLFIQKAALPEKVMNWPGVLGMYKDLLLVVDHRTPTIKRAGSALTAGYMRHGNNDTRDRGAATTSTDRVYDVATLHGKGAVWKWEPEPIHTIEQTDDYGKVKGVGSACVRGIGIPMFWENIEDRFNTVTPQTPTQTSSAAIICALPGDAPSP